MKNFLFKSIRFDIHGAESSPSLIIYYHRPSSNIPIDLFTPVNAKLLINFRLSTPPNTDRNRVIIPRGKEGRGGIDPCRHINSSSVVDTGLLRGGRVKGQATTLHHGNFDCDDAGGTTRSRRNNENA